MAESTITPPWEDFQTKPWEDFQPVLSRNETGPAIPETPEYLADLAALRQRMNQPSLVQQQGMFSPELGMEQPFGPVVEKPLVDPSNLVGTRGPLLGALTRAVPQINPYIDALQRGSAAAVKDMTMPSTLAQTPAYFVPYLGQALALKTGAETLGDVAGTIAGNPTAITALEQAPKAAVGTGMLLGGGAKTLERPSVAPVNIPPGTKPVFATEPPLQLRGPTLALEAPERHFQVAPSEVPSPYGPRPPSLAAQNIMQISPGELREFQREAQSRMTAQEHQAADIEAKTRQAVDVPLVGGFTMPLRTIEQLRAELSGQTTPTLLPQIVAPTGPVGTPAERPGGGPAVGGQVSFAGQGVPSARQAAVFPKVGGEQEELMRGQFVPVIKGGEQNAERIRSDQGQIPSNAGQEGEAQVQRERGEDVRGENLQQSTQGQSESVGARTVAPVKFTGMQQAPEGVPPSEQWTFTENVPPNFRAGMTVSRTTLENAGFTVPERPITKGGELSAEKTQKEVLPQGTVAKETPAEVGTTTPSERSPWTDEQLAKVKGEPGYVGTVELLQWAKRQPEFANKVAAYRDYVQKRTEGEPDTLQQGVALEEMALELAREKNAAGSSEPKGKIVPVETAAPPDASARRVAEIIERLRDPGLTKEERGDLAKELAGMRKPAAKKGIKPTINPRGGEAGGGSAHEMVKEALRTVSEGARYYSEPILDRLGRLGGTASKVVSAKAQQIVSRMKGFYGSLTPTLDPAKAAAGKLSKTTTWVRQLNKVTDRGATNNLFDMSEGAVPVPANAKDMLDKLNRANAEIDKLRWQPTGQLQRIRTNYGLDVIRRGGGSAWEAETEAVAKKNNKPVAEVRDFYRNWKDELDKPLTDVAKLDKIAQDFVQLYPKTITHIKPGVAWHEVVVSDPFNYLEAAAQRTAHGAAFREVYKPGTDTLSNDRKAVMRELHTGTNKNEFNNLIAALQGHPLDSFTSGMTAPDTLLGGGSRMASSTVGTPLKSLVLTGNFITNLSESVTGGPSIFLGYGRVLRNMLRSPGGWRAVYKQIELNGQVNKAMQNWAFDPSSPGRSTVRIVANALRTGTAQQILNELQEAQGAMAASAVANEIRNGTLGPYWQQRVIAVMRSMGFSDKAARDAVAGRNNTALTQFERKASAWLSAGNVTMAERSRLGASRAFNELFWFHSYPQMTMNQLQGTFKAWTESIRQKDPKQIWHTSALLGRQLGGRTLQGALQAGIAALAYFGLEGLQTKTQEAKDEPWEFLLDSFIGAMGGPVSVLKRALEMGGDSTSMGALLGSTVTPLGMGGELADAGMGYGRYEGRTRFERIGMFVQSKTPGWQAVKTGMSLFGLGMEDRELNNAMRSMYRWRREELGWRKEIGTETEGAAFRAQMRRALDALRNGKDWKSELIKAGDPMQVADSLAARTVLRTPEGKPLSTEQLAALRKRIGDRPVERLESYDAMLRLIAEDIRRFKRVEDVEKPVTEDIQRNVERLGERRSLREERARDKVQPLELPPLRR